MPLDDDALRARYPSPRPRALEKVTSSLSAQHRGVLARSPFCVIGSVGRGGLDVSPRGGPPGFVVALDARTLLMPDHRGNNRLDTLGNVLDDPRVGLLFFVPGSNETLRINGRAQVRFDDDLLERVGGPVRPHSVLRIDVDEAFHHCARAPMRAGLWDTSTWPADPPRISRTPDSSYEDRLYPAPDEEG